MEAHARAHVRVRGYCLMESPITFEKEYEITMSMVNINGKLGIFGLLNLIQDIASLHGEAQGYGYSTQIKQNQFWVLVGQKIKMKRWPKWSDKVRFKTWVRPIRHKIVYRDVEFYQGDELLGECNISWLLIDGTTRKSVRLEAISPPPAVRDDYHLDFTAGKIQKHEGLERVNDRIVRVTDLDVNHHVNNTKYTQWVLDTIELKYHKQMFLQEFEINFLAEARLDDLVEIQRSEIGAENVSTQFFGIRKEDAKPIFISNFKGILKA